MTTLKFPFTSATAEEHMKALKDYYPDARSADAVPYDEPDANYCVGGGLCRYLLGEITNWEVDDALYEIQDIIKKSADDYEYEDDVTYHDIRFPNYEIVGEALNYIAYKFNFKDRIYNRIKVESETYANGEGYIEGRVQGFFNWLGSGVVHYNDLGHIGFAWDWIKIVFDKELLDMHLEQYVAELNGSPSHIFRTEDW